MRKIIALILVLGLAFSLSTPNTAYAKKSSKKALDIVTVTVASVGYRTAVVTSDGALWMWGGNVASENPWFQYTPIKLIDKDVVSVSCSRSNTAVIKTDGSLWMWGGNTKGELGLGTKSVVDVDKPTKIMDNAAMVSCGTHHTAVLKNDGSLWLFGSNEFGQIGNDYQGDAEAESFIGTKCPIQTTPVKVMDDVSYVSCGDYFTTAIKKDGTLWAWGSNQYGEIGNGKRGYRDSVIDYSADVHVPQMIMEDVALVSCSHYTMVVKRDGTLWGWGQNAGCVFGADSVARGAVSTVPIKVTDNVLSVHTGYEVVSVMKTDGSLWMGGFIPAGDLEKALVNITDGGCRIAVAEETAAFIVKTDGNLYGWGDKSYLGIGSYSDDIQTKPVKILKNVMIPDVPSATTRQEVNEAIDAKLVPKALQKNYGKLITRDGLEKLLTQLIKKVGGDANAREILTDSDGTFNPKGKVTESRFVTVIKRTAKALGVKYKSFGLKRSKTKLTTERAIVMIYRAYKMLKK